MLDFLSNMIQDPNYNILGRILADNHEAGIPSIYTTIGNLSVGAICYALYLKSDKERVAGNNKLVTVLETTLPLLSKVADVLDRVEKSFSKTAEKVEVTDLEKWQDSLEKTMRDIRQLLSER